MRNQFFHGLIILVLMATPARAAESIVGIWSHDAAFCKTADKVMIKPLGIEFDYVICHFETVKRSGNTVTWKGACYVDSIRRPETGSGTVEGVLRNAKLTISGLGFGMNDLVRCK